MKEDRYAPAERATACDSVAALAAASGAERGGGDASGAAAEVGASWDGGHSAAAPCASAAAAAASAAAPVVQVPAIVPDVPMRRALGLAAIGSASDALVPDIRQFGGSGLGSVRGVRPVESACVSGLLSGQPTGSETEPWSMMGSFEDLLNGLVTDEPEEEEEEEEATLPGRSRFARFFSSPSTEEHMVGGGPGAGGASALASLGGIKLDAPFEPAKQQDDWQQGFRALLPNVNISFSPFGDSAGPSQADGLAPQGPVAVPKSLGVVGGMGGLGFGAFGASGVGSLGQPSAAAPVVGSATPFSSSTSGGLGGSFELPGGGLGSGFGAAALNGGAGLPGLGGTPSSTGEVSILHQLSSSGQLPGAQLQLSSQLQSLLQGANGSTRATGLSHAAESAHMPGWEGLLTKGDEQPKEQAGGSSARKKEGGGSERGGKGKKRGGTSNRSKSGEAKLQPPAHNGK